MTSSWERQSSSTVRVVLAARLAPRGSHWKAGCRNCHFMPVANQRCARCCRAPRKPGVPWAGHQLGHQLRNSGGTHKLLQLAFLRGLECRSPLRADTESSLSLSSRRGKGFAKNRGFLLHRQLVFTAEVGGEGLGPRGCCSAVGSAHHLPVAQLCSRHTLGVVQLQTFTGEKKRKGAKGRLCSSCGDYGCALRCPALQECSVL